MTSESWVVVGLVAALWFVREAIPLLAKAIRGNGNSKKPSPLPPPPPREPLPSSADGSGAFAALGEQIASRRELDALRSEVRDSIERLSNKLDNYAGTTNARLEALARGLGQVEGVTGVTTGTRIGRR